MRDDRARLEIPWPRVIGMRNILIHGYLAIDLEEVWVTVERRVPVLRNQIETMLREDTSAEPQTVFERLAAYRLALQFSRDPPTNWLALASPAQVTTSLDS